MPMMNGFDPYREIRRVDTSVEICFFSAFQISEKEFSTVFPELKPSAIFCKPISVQELALRLDDLLLLIREKREKRTTPQHIHDGEPISEVLK